LLRPTPELVIIIEITEWMMFQDVNTDGMKIHVETKFVPKDLEKSVEASTKDMVYAVKA